MVYAEGDGLADGFTPRVLCNRSRSNGSRRNHLREFEMATKNATRAPADKPKKGTPRTKRDLKAVNQLILRLGEHYTLSQILGEFGKAGRPLEWNELWLEELWHIVVAMRAKGIGVNEACRKYAVYVGVSHAVAKKRYTEANARLGQDCESLNEMQNAVSSYLAYRDDWRMENGEPDDFRARLENLVSGDPKKSLQKSARTKVPEIEVHSRTPTKGELNAVRKLAKILGGDYMLFQVREELEHRKIGRPAVWSRYLIGEIFTAIIVIRTMRKWNVTKACEAYARWKGISVGTIEKQYARGQEVWGHATQKTMRRFSEKLLDRIENDDLRHMLDRMGEPDF